MPQIIQLWLQYCNVLQKDQQPCYDEIAWLSMQLLMVCNNLNHLEILQIAAPSFRSPAATIQRFHTQRDSDFSNIWPVQCRFTCKMILMVMLAINVLPLNCVDNLKELLSFSILIHKKSWKADKGLVYTTLYSCKL